MQIINVNKYWGGNNPFMTIITPVYNREKTILRTMESVEKQSFRRIEYIIIDDGSSDDSVRIIKRFMESTTLPMMFIRKNNGGVHTARNAGVMHANGEMTICIDSDDELLPEACEVFYKTWRSIPNKKEVWQIKGQCIDQDGNPVGSLFPENINQLSKKQSKKYFSMAKGEQLGCRKTDILRNHLFPEPDEITFVRENLVWVPLELKYRSWGINNVLRIYHKDGNDHLSKRIKKKTKQDYKNRLYNFGYELNHSDLFALTFARRVKLVCGYLALVYLLKRMDEEDFLKKYRLSGWKNKLIQLFVWVPSIVLAKRL